MGLAIKMGSGRNLTIDVLNFNCSASSNVTTSQTAPADGYYLLIGCAANANNSATTTLTYTGATVLETKSYSNSSNHMNAKLAFVYQKAGGTLSVQCKNSGDYPRTIRVIARLY